MKKIVNVNIGGVPFTLDEDAYDLLKQYLSTLREIFHDDDEDLLSDIEGRIAELLLQNVAEGRIVTIADVRREIAVIGDPKDFNDDEEIIVGEREEIADSPQYTESPLQTPPPVNPDLPRVEHKLYRDPRNKMIAGVCSGIAAYNHISVNTVRLVTVAACFATAFFPLGAVVSVWVIPIIYACFWIAVPEARTPLEFMQLYGDNASMAEVAKAVSNHYDPAAATERNESGFWATVGSIIMTIVKGFFGFLAIVIGVPIVIALIILAVVLLVVVLSELFGSVAAVNITDVAPFLNDFPAAPWIGLLWVIGLLAVILIPGWVVVRNIFKLDTKHPASRTSRIIWLILWVLSILLTTWTSALIF